MLKQKVAELEQKVDRLASLLGNVDLQEILEAHKKEKEKKYLCALSYAYSCASNSKLNVEVHGFTGTTFSCKDFAVNKHVLYNSGTSYLCVSQGIELKRQDAASIFKLCSLRDKGETK